MNSVIEHQQQIGDTLDNPDNYFIVTVGQDIENKAVDYIQNLFLEKIEFGWVNRRGKYISLNESLKK